MNKQMTPAEIEFVQQSSWCGLARTIGRSAMSVKEKFTGLDKFDTLLGPNEDATSVPLVSGTSASFSQARYRRYKIRAGRHSPDTKCE